MLFGLLYKLMSQFGNFAKMTMKDSNVGNNQTGSAEDADDFINQIKGIIEEQTKQMYSNESFLQKQNRLYSEDYSDANALEEALAKETGMRLTNAEQQANQFNRNERLMAQEFSHNEAVDARMWQQYVEENKYAWNTQSMQNAGLNPAMMYGGGSLVGTAATGAMGNSSPASSVSPSSSGDIFNLLMSLIRLPMEMKSLNADIKLANANADKAEKEGDAATKNAETNATNAATNATNAETNKRLATVQEMRVEIDSRLADSHIELNSAQKEKLAMDCVILQHQNEQMDEYLDIARENANSQQMSALASLQSSNAAIRNAAVNEKLSDSEIALRTAQAYVAWADGEGKLIVNKYLDEKTQKEIELLSKEGQLTNTKKWREIVGIGADVAGAVAQFVGPGKLLGKGIKLLTKNEGESYSSTTEDVYDKNHNFTGRRTTRTNSSYSSESSSSK